MATTKTRRPRIDTRGAHLLLQVRCTVLNGDLQKTTYTCPSCGGEITGTPSWGGFIRTYPKRCPHCQRRLGYDLVGGVDNGPEFHGTALERGCREYGITLLHRPVARPHFGGHIERLIGTMMGRVHLLPGTTDSSPSARGGYDSEATAVLTLWEFARWLSLEIGQYHQHEHRILGTTPATAWSDSLTAGVTPVVPAHPEALLISFLPVTRRRLQRNGLHFERIRYWADVLPVIAQPREPLIVRYDPRDISRLYVIGKDQHYHPIPYANVTRPPISLAEVRYAYAALRAQGKKNVDEGQIFAFRTKQCEIVESATAATKAMRRKVESQRRPLAVNPVVSAIDYEQEAIPSPGEIWVNRS